MAMVESMKSALLKSVVLSPLLVAGCSSATAGGQEWGPAETVALVAAVIAGLSILVTGVISVVALVLNHRREKALHQASLEAERARDHREDATNAAYMSRNAIYDARTLATETAAPRSPEDVRVYISAGVSVFSSIADASQPVRRLVTLGWSEPVREAARELDSRLMDLSVSVSFPNLVIDLGYPDADPMARRAR